MGFYVLTQLFIEFATSPKLLNRGHNVVTLSFAYNSFILHIIYNIVYILILLCVCEDMHAPPEGSKVTKWTEVRLGAQLSLDQLKDDHRFGQLREADEQFAEIVSSKEGFTHIHIFSGIENKTGPGGPGGDLVHKNQKENHL